MEIKKYPDGTSYVTPDNDEKYVTIKINSYEDLWQLNQFIDAYNNHYNKRLHITIPNLLDGQADKRFKSNQSSGLKLVGQFLNKMDANFTIFHPHNAEVVEALIPRVKITDNSQFINYILLNHLMPVSILNKRILTDDLILMSSDAGGFKPLSHLCDKIRWRGEMYSAAKARSWDETEGTKFIQQIDRQDFKGKDVMIVDDICVYGGTFKGLSKLLKERNCGKLYLAVSHMTVQDLGEDPVTNYFDEVFTTNSKYDSYTYIRYPTEFSGTTKIDTEQPNNLHIINLF